MFDASPRRYAKELPGASLTYQPPELPRYANDPWDIRVSLGTAPLEDAFYCTIADPADIQLSIGELLERHVLDIERRDELDIVHYPELPMLQAELIQLFAASTDGRLNLELYVNKSSTAGPVSRDESAAGHLCVCTFYNGSYDYRVLDLVVQVASQASAIDSLVDDLGPFYLLRLFAHWEALGRLPALLRTSQFRTALGAEPDGASRLSQLLSAAVQQGWISDGRPRITDDGRRVLVDAEAELDELQQSYNHYSSVSFWPPALGVPDGFDIRLQLMRRDGKDVPHCLLLHLLEGTEPLFFGEGNWAERLESGAFFERLHELLAHETSFADELLETLLEAKG